MGLTRYNWRTASRETAIVFIGVCFCAPLYLLLAISLKTTPAAYLHPLSFPTSPYWSSYSQAFTSLQPGMGMGHALVGSLIITAGSIGCLVLIGSVTAYAIARRVSKMGTALYITFLMGIIVPWELGLVPLYVAMRHVHLVGNYVGLILFYTGLFIPLTVFLYSGFVRTLPRDYEEAAQVDGASQRRTFFRVVLPLLLPVTGTVMVIDGLFIWNQFFTQLIFLSGTPNSTVPVAVYSIANSSIEQAWNVTFAAIAIALAPILAFFLFAPADDDPGVQRRSERMSQWRQ